MFNIAHRTPHIAQLILLFFAILISSCKSHQDVVYLQQSEEEIFDLRNRYETAIKPGDRLSIIVNSPQYPELAQQFNMQLMGPTLTPGTTINLWSGAPQPFEVNAAGCISYPIYRHTRSHRRDTQRPRGVHRQVLARRRLHQRSSSHRPLPRSPDYRAWRSQPPRRIQIRQRLSHTVRSIIPRRRSHHLWRTSQHQAHSRIRWQDHHSCARYHRSQYPEEPILHPTAERSDLRRANQGTGQ